MTTLLQATLRGACLFARDSVLWRAGQLRGMSTQLVETRCIMHNRAVTSVNFSPDSKLLCSSSEDKSVQIHDITTGELLRQVEHAAGVWYADFGRDGELFCTASEDGTVRIYELETGELMEMFGHGMPVRSAAFCPVGERLATAAGDGTARVFDLDSGSEVLPRLKHGSWVLSVRFSPDGRLICTGSGDNKARVFCSETGKLLATLPHDGWVTSVEFGADGQLFSACKKQVRHFEWRSGQELFTVQLPGLAWSAQLSPDRQLLCTASSAGLAQIFAAETGELLQELSHSGAVRSAALSSSGHLATGCEDWSVRLFQPDAE
eukprot:TRINITY_DN7292_c0_g3_i1.p1 TRINITY_DN7292_c0_g3~~TRINITY_DN7292_c0_g3_i1.p1  ORF type:complete len:320 (+),score=59.92 TRINITY_DN7292_c0_g3_i1:168-1127(+)